MDFSLTDEQEQIQSSAAEFFDNEEILAAARRQLDGEDVFEEVWEKLTAVEYPAMTVPVDHGGLGDELLNFALLLEASGGHAPPVPLLETGGVAVTLIDDLGTEKQCSQWLGSIAEGDLTASIGLYADTTESLPAGIGLDVEPVADGYRLTGSLSLVPFGGLVDRVIVAARSQRGQGFEGISLFVVDPDEVGVERQDGLDRTRPPFELHFDDHHVTDAQLLGPLHSGGQALERALDWYRVGACATLLGAADRAIDLSVEHANEREQFGEPIGRFQAVKHRIVDMWMDVQAGRSLTHYAAWAIDNDQPDARLAVARATGFVTENTTRIFGDDIQNHGGRGYTWDHDAHIYLKQAKVLESYLGTPRDHRERTASLWEN